MHLAILLFTAVAQAYVPPSFYIFTALSHKHASIDDVSIRHKITLYRKSGETQEVFSDSVGVNSPDHVSVRVYDKLGAEIATLGRTLISSKSSESTRPITYDLLYLKDANSSFEHFKALGLPLKSEVELYSEKEGALPYKPESYISFKRYENRVAEVIASADSPQLWIEKDSFLPLRAVLSPMEFRFSGYQVHKNFLYPRVVDVYRYGQLWARIETLEAKPGAGTSLDGSRVQSGLDGDVKDFLEIYLKWVR
jgi:hypothetical protein